jgi:hypothetical protein
MRSRRLSIVVVVLLLVPTAARAHDHTADFFSAFCYAHASNLFGVQQSVAVTLPWPDNDDLSFVFDTSAHMGTHDGDPRTRVAVLVGARYTFEGLINAKNLLSVHALGGGVRDAGVITQADPAFAFGGGYEFLQGGNPLGWGFRAQVDYVVSGGENFPRFSGGLVFRK